MNAKLILLAVAVAVIGAGALMMCDDSDAAAGDVLASGSCGTDLTYEVKSLIAGDSQTELVINGSGDMTNWGNETSVPWRTYAQKMKNISLPEGLTTIGNYAFTKFNYLTTAAIPDSVTTIGKNAFYACPKLASIAISDSVTTIGDGAFRQCNSLVSVTIPDSVTTIGTYAFGNCAVLANVHIGESVISIGEGAFFSTALVSVTLPDSVTTIGKNAFGSNTNLKEISVSLGNGYFASNESTLFNKTLTKLILYPRADERTTYSIPDSVTLIDENAFLGSSNLVSVTIPDSVTTIGATAFRQCNALVSVTIPDSVTTIGTNAFSECPNLISATMPFYSGTTNTGFNKLESLTYLTTGDWTSSNRTYSPQYSSRATLQSITFADDRIPANALYNQNLDTLTITNARGDGVIGIYTSPTTRATAEDLTVTGTAAYIVRFTDLYGNAELIDGGITTNNVTIGWNTTPDGYGTGPVDASPEVLIYPAKIGNKSPYSGLYGAIPLIVIVAIITTIIGMMAVRRD